MASLAVRVPDTLTEALDGLVSRGRYPNRTAAVREALERLIADEHRRAIDAAIVEGYARTPSEPPDDLDRTLAERSVRQEPW
jgi:Arc/MetJ-type ribon-helix-helix transcriptional regulator